MCHRCILCYLVIVIAIVVEEPVAYTVGMVVHMDKQHAIFQDAWFRCCEQAVCPEYTAAHRRTTHHAMSYHVVQLTRTTTRH